LAKLASSEEAINQQIEVQYSPSHTEEEMNPIDVNNSWMTPITKYLEEGTLPTDVVEARKLKGQVCKIRPNTGDTIQKRLLTPIPTLPRQTRS
jgi:GMP synthase PP-ATPase subunit